MNKRKLEELIKEAIEASSEGVTWTAFCRKKRMTAAKMRTALFRASQETGTPIPTWISKRGARADQKITVQKKGIVIISKSRLPDEWKVGDKLEVITEENSIIIRKS